MTVTETVKGRRGFASMDPEKRRAIARLGGMAVKPESRSFSKDRALASNAGRKGGKATPAHKRAFADLALARAAGRKGGQSGRNT
jgi:uncharacterized protein